MPIVNAHIDQFLDANDSPIIDVRSPGEFQVGHIKGAVSLPLFSDEERSEIGILYKNLGKLQAVKRGLEIVGPKMVEFADKAEGFKSNSFRIHCWRGGMRSESMAWLFDKLGMEVMLLKGGYKAFRQYQIQFFEKPLPIHVLSGYTGSKKTIILQSLLKDGQQVVDLEQLANHQGSSFGNQKSDYQPTTEQFQNNVFSEFYSMDLNCPIWIEDESMRIGDVNMLESLYTQKNNSPHYVIEASRSQRIAFLCEDYGNLSKEKLLFATNSIGKKLGTENVAVATKSILENDLATACDIILEYYDKRYGNSLKNKSSYIKATIPVDLENIDEVVNSILNEL